MIVALLAGCASDGSAASLYSHGFSVSGAAIPRPAVAPRSLFGAYLAGNFAVAQHDDLGALGYYADILKYDPGNGTVAFRSLQVAVDAGRFDIAIPLARQLLKSAPDLPLANIVVAIADFKAGNPKLAAATVARLPSDGLFVLFGSLVTAWSDAAQNPGNSDGVDSLLAPVARNPELADLALIHLALIEDLAGRDGVADRDYRAALKLGPPPLRLVQLVGNFWERTDKRAEAAALYQTFARGPGNALGVTPRVATGRPPARLIASPVEGLAEAMFDIGSLADTANLTDVALLATRLSLFLRPNFPEAEFTLAQSFVARGQTDAALAIYHGVAPSSPFAWAARIAGVQLLAKLHHGPEAIAALQPLIAAHPDRVEPLILLGDLRRNAGDLDAAIAAYSKALSLIGANGNPEQRWQLLFSRGAAREQSHHWPEGEADLRQALALFEDPELQNYLGFALVIRDEKLAEARHLIAAAVASAPDNGAYLDSLGWADYHLRRYQRAKTELEQATQLDPTNAEINDHLGDALWRCGEKAEARLQWQRALGFNPDADLAKSIQTKLLSKTGL